MIFRIDNPILEAGVASNDRNKKVDLTLCDSFQCVSISDSKRKNDKGKIYPIKNKKSKKCLFVKNAQKSVN
jgi:hypothetical protein